ncbi:hypothetical protein Amal_03705 [Acetobacter malorum]|uniref:Uncharacterized protein n=1 Tax=Acetobacter malorum TaxID=178901 RepID=A0A177G430_9PROT|nr:hypothetical protein Amal_03705 [Acetobacter malorum]
MLPDTLRRRCGECHAILKLIPEAKGTAGLIKAGSGQNAAGEGLIQKPAIEHDIHAPVRGFDLNGMADSIPSFGNGLQNGIKVSRAISQNEPSCLGCIRRFTKQKDNFNATIGRQCNQGLQNAAGVQSCSCYAIQAIRMGKGSGVVQ